MVSGLLRCDKDCSSDRRFGLDCTNAVSADVEDRMYEAAKQAGVTLLTITWVAIDLVRRILR